MSKKIIMSVASLVAVAACMVVPAMASATPVLTETVGGVGTPLKPGAKIEGTNTAAITFTSSPNVVCKESTITGEVVTNSGKLIEGTITKATFTGTGGGTCESELGATTVTTEIATVDWCIKSVGGSTNEFTVQGGGCGAAAQALNFTLDVSGLSCSYTRAAASPVVGTFTTGEPDAVLSFSGQEFKKSAGSFLCPGSGKLDGSYTLETDESTTGVYIE